MRPATTEIYYNPDLTQIINGEEVMSPSPKLNHEFVQSELSFLLKTHVKALDLGRICNAPLDVIFEEGFNVLQPDIMFISKANSGIIQDWVRGAPDLAVEIVSPSSAKMDTVVKKSIYESYGVREYWLVFPKTRTIEVHSLEKGKYILTNTFTSDQQLRSPLLTELTFLVSSIFE